VEYYEVPRKNEGKRDVLLVTGIPADVLAEISHSWLLPLLIAELPVAFQCSSTRGQVSVRSSLGYAV
jgi:hypothetical protein